jgi:hypothetical protein
MVSGVTIDATSARASSDGLAPHGKSSALIVGQSQSSATELLFEDSILFTEILDDRRIRRIKRVLRPIVTYYVN